MSSKADLRIRMKAIRHAMTAAEVRLSSVRACSRLLDLSIVCRAKLLLVYVSIGKEVSTDGLIRHLLRSGKRVAIPRVLDSSCMEACEIRGWGDWRPSVFGIPAPKNGLPLSMPVDVCVIPGLAFSRQGDRLGFGCGHWDRFLEQAPAKTIIGLCHDWQIVDVLPTEDTDKPADLVLTEGRMIWRGSRGKPLVTL